MQTFTVKNSRIGWLYLAALVAVLALMLLLRLGSTEAGAAGLVVMALLGLLAFVLSRLTVSVDDEWLSVALAGAPTARPGS